MSEATVPKAMTIAGSDSGGGAGIQADLKTFAAFGVFGTSAITAVTAQNSLGVTAAVELSPDVVGAQIDAIMSDIGAGAAKTGMLANREIIRTVAAKVRKHRVEKLVVDPVMIATSGARLLHEDALETYKSVLFPLALIVTPNVPEAEALSGRHIRTLGEMREAARIIGSFGTRYVLMKGGHMEGATVTDLLFDGTAFTEFTGARVATENTHGTGCTLSAAIAAGLARGRALADAVGEAKQYVEEALRSSYMVGGGPGPVNHMFGVAPYQPAGNQLETSR